MLNNKPNISWQIWGIAFLYTCIVSVFIQFILLPILLPRLHANGGLFAGCPDCIGFNQIAVDMAQKIKTFGWSAWQLRPQNHAPAGIASIIYTLTWSKLWVLIPLNAIMHASAFLILFQLVDLFLKDKNKSFFCALPFLVFPSNLQWSAQLHKDGFSILGVLLFLYVVVSLFRLENWNRRKWYLVIFRLLVFYVIGIHLILLVRPFMVMMIRFTVLLLFPLLSVIFLFWVQKEILTLRKVLLTLVFFLIFLIILFRVNADFITDDHKKILRVSLSASPTEEKITKPKIQGTKKTILVPVIKPFQKEIVLNKASDNEAVMAEKPKSSELSEDIPYAASLFFESLVKEDAPVIVKDTALVVENNAPVVMAREVIPVIVKDGPSVEVKDSVVPMVEKKEKPASIIPVSVVQEASEVKLEAEDRWIRSSWLPFFVESKIYALAQTRKAFRFSGIGAKSNIDHDIGFNSARSVFFYLPRAAQIVLLAPFPNQWFAQGSSAGSSLMRKISAFEMTVIYLALIFLPFALWCWRRRVEIWIIFLFCISMMLIYALVVCNVGTLYRMRYAYITTLAALGIAGFFVFLDMFIFKGRRNIN